MDGLAQRLPFKADPVDGQNSVSYVDGPGSEGQEGRGETVTRLYQTATTEPVGESCQTASDWTQIETKRLLVVERNQPAIVQASHLFSKRAKKKIHQ